ncbi:hypothetical protein [Streptomyces sp. NPDC093707]|uniref:hypothetical protein n=1 Tax=Streptomyces sp. NPDC093707 TaxID=3154984 RepID=UPI003450EADD
MKIEQTKTVRVRVPVVPARADVQRSWRQIVTGLDSGAAGAAAVLGPEVGHGALVTVAPGALLLSVDQHVTGWRETFVAGGIGKPYPLMDAAVTLYRVQDDGELKTEWARHFKTVKGAFGREGHRQIRKHLEARPTVAGSVQIVDPGPGRPNKTAGTCRWCAGQLPAGRGALVGRGPGVEMEHPRKCPPRPAEPQVACALCARSVAPGTAELVLVREGEGRWEVQHTGGRCEARPSYEEYLEQVRRQRDVQAAQREAAKAAEAKRAARRERAAEKRRKKAEEEEAAAAAVKQRVVEVGIRCVSGTTELYDKGLSPTGLRMRLVEQDLELADGSAARWWVVQAYGGSEEFEDGEEYQGGPYYLLRDAREEYQCHRYEAAAPVVARRRWEPAACPADDPSQPHCDHCGRADSDGGWMAASLGRACGEPCYTAMSDAPGAHARRYH